MFDDEAAKPSKVAQSAQRDIKNPTTKIVRDISAAYLWQNNEWRLSFKNQLVDHEFPKQLICKVAGAFLYHQQFINGIVDHFFYIVEGAAPFVDGIRVAISDGKKFGQIFKLLFYTLGLFGGFRQMEKRNGCFVLVDIA